jgi:1-acyl-sn-glycerol-3-phosphate acyltransferase
MGTLSLIYFGLLGLLFFAITGPFLIVLALLSALGLPTLMNIFFYIMVKMTGLYLAFSPLKYKNNNMLDISKNNQGPAILIANHRSHLDMFLFLSKVYKVRAVANAKLFHIPLLGQFMSMSKHFKMEKGNVNLYQQSLEQIKIAFSENYKILFFPEMTRCLPGLKDIQKFRLIPFQIAREENIPIIPVVISGTDEIWPKGKMQMNFSHKISIKTLAPINPQDFSSSADLAKHTHHVMKQTLGELQ